MSGTQILAPCVLAPGLLRFLLLSFSALLPRTDWTHERG